MDTPSSRSAKVTVYGAGLRWLWKRRLSGRFGREVMAGVIDQDIRRDIGGDDQRVDSVSTDWSDETFKHVMLPIWMAAYKYNDKSYRFVVNGQTGKVQGERPYSAWKIALAVVLGLVVAGAIFYVTQKQ